MPFVVVERGPNSWDKNKIERLCKDAWGAMNQVSGDAFKVTDVGGVVITRHLLISSVMNVKFFYCDRGSQFKRGLYRELTRRFGQYDIIQVVPTKTEDWFVDPVWAMVREDNSEFDIPF